MGRALLCDVASSHYISVAAPSRLVTYNWKQTIFSIPGFAMHAVAINYHCCPQSTPFVSVPLTHQRLRAQAMDSTERGGEL